MAEKQETHKAKPPQQWPPFGQIDYEQKDSVKITKNAKGEYTWEIKRYHNAADTTSQQIVSELVQIDRELKEAFLNA